MPARFGSEVVEQYAVGADIVQQIVLNSVPVWSAASSSSSSAPVASSSSSATPSVSSSSSSAITSGDVFEYLLVAGGGGGGTSQDGAGGGGAGGLLSGAFTLAAQDVLNITVGAGGINGVNGQNSVFSSFTAIGGGYGGNNDAPNGSNGGSGGGVGRDGCGTPGTGAAGQGNNGGNTECSGYRSAGGGGGAGEAGYDGGYDAGNISGTTAKGGNGVTSSITGEATYYAGGGGGGYSGGAIESAAQGGLGGGGNGGGGSSATGQNGVANTGGGGGGGRNGAGGTGGSGVVVVAYPDTYGDLAVSSTLTYTQPIRAGYKVYKFTAGSGSIAFQNQTSAPIAPSSVTGVAGNQQVVLSWTAAFSAGPSITDYIVQYQAQSSSVPGDSLWSDVKLLLPLDSNFADASTTNTTFTALGGATIDTANKQFGAGALPVGGFPAGYGISTTSAPTIGSGDFTIEWWQNFASVGSSNSTIMSWNAENFSTAWFQVRSTGTQWAVEATRYDNIDEVYRNTQLLFANPSGWAHIAIVRQSGTWRVYVNGTQAASASENSTGESASGASGPLSFPSGNVAFGRSYGGSGGRYAPAGYLDDIRLTLAVRYPSGTTFTAPASAHYTSAPSVGGPGAWTTFSDGTGTGTTATITGLTNDTEYLFRVAAINSIGTGPYATSSGVTPNLFAITTQPKNDYATSGSQNITFSVGVVGGGTPTYQWQYFGPNYDIGDYDSIWRNISGATSSSYTTNGNTMSGSNLLSYDFYYTGGAKLRCVVTAAGGTPALTSDAVRFLQLDVLHAPSVYWEGNQGNYPNYGQPQTISLASGENLLLDLYDYGMSSPDVSWYTGNDMTLKVQVATNGYTDSADWTDLYTVDVRQYIYLPDHVITPSTGTKYYRAIVVHKWPYTVNNGTQSATYETSYTWPRYTNDAIQVTWP